MEERTPNINKKSIAAFNEKIREEIRISNQRKLILDSQIERFHVKYKDRLDEVIEKIMAHYESEKYVRREYSMGYEPRTDLYWFLLSYAEIYGNKCNDKRYSNSFTSVMYRIGSYVIQAMCGQGCVIRIDKWVEPIEPTDSTDMAFEYETVYNWLRQMLESNSSNTTILSNFRDIFYKD